MIRDFASSLWRGEEGATTVEHALMIALIAGAVVTVGVGLSTAMNGTFHAAVEWFE